MGAAARGERGGTLWFDEVFDALDQDGLEAVAGALEELASTRMVMVITHSPELARRLPAAQRLHLSRGQVTLG
jgi:DNA repair exonuclease SbcCD ATPase subunit